MVQVGSAIKCQKCSGDFGLCDGLYDNGETVECPGDQDLCFYHEFCKHYLSSLFNHINYNIHFLRLHWI